MASHTTKYLNDSQIHIIESWREFQELVTGPQYRSWAFRGQEKSEWPLNSTISRHFIDYKVHQDVWAHQEDRILRVFRRKAHLFLQHIPAEDDTFQWLALMQHHGAPTRLLDFTWSPFVAAFFALEKAKTDCAVWAVNFPKIWERNLELFPQVYLFSVSLDFVDELDQREVSARLREQFTSHDQPLTPQALIEADRAGANG